MAPTRALPPRGVLRPAAAASRVRLELLPPAPDLACVVERHWVLSWDLEGEPPHVQHALPHPCVNIAFEPARHGVYGIPRRRVTRALTGTGVVVGTRLRAGGLSVYSDMPASALTGTVASLTEVLGPPGAELATAVLAAGGPRERLATVEAFLRTHLRPLASGALLAQRAVDDIASAPPGTTTAAVARARGVSPRTLQRVFSRYVGVGPKWVLARRRIHDAAERIAADPGVDLGRLALDLGYSDQAHFANDFRALIGRPPSAYRAA